MNYTREDFFAGKIGCRCDTRQEYDQLMRECEAKGLRWNMGEKPSEYDGYGPGVIVYKRSFNNGITRTMHKASDDNALPFSALFLDPWADFCAGRCYLRVTEDEWPEFAKRLVSEGYVWGSGRDPRTTSYFLGDSDYVAQIDDIGGGRRLFGTMDVAPNYDKPVHPFSAIARPEALPRKIIITTDGHVTTARLIEGKQTVKTATATCSPEDVFDFDEGATRAYNRLRFGQDFNGPSLADNLRLVANIETALKTYRSKC